MKYQDNQSFVLNVEQSYCVVINIVVVVVIKEKLIE